MAELIVVGGGLSGCEAAWQAAESGISVDVYEMRPAKSTGAHLTGFLAELVCSNSLGSNLADRASGLLKEELRQLESMLLACAEQTTLPAGGALAVDREAFAELVTRKIESHQRIHVIRTEMQVIPSSPAVIASGPLTSASLADAIQNLTGQDRLFFYDAIAPVVTAESINMQIAYYASRFNLGETKEGDYINCPLNEEQYHTFVQALKTAKRTKLREFEETIHKGVRAGLDHYFEGCLPVEIIAERGELALTFGPMRPIGLRDPRTGRWPFAVLQLRRDNLAASLYNLVGFQTNLTIPEQQRVFRMVPGLEQAEFSRFGQMHRNTFIASPLVLNSSLQLRSRSNLFFAGQIVGVEGYMGNIATGWLAGINAARYIRGQPLLDLPATTMIGALCRYITTADMQDFQPMKANYGILPPLEHRPQGRKERNQLYLRRSIKELVLYLSDRAF